MLQCTFTNNSLGILFTCIWRYTKLCRFKCLIRLWHIPMKRRPTHETYFYHFNCKMRNAVLERTENDKMSNANNRLWFDILETQLTAQKNATNLLVFSRQLNSNTMQFYNDTIFDFPANGKCIKFMRLSKCHNKISTETEIKMRKALIKY